MHVSEQACNNLGDVKYGEDTEEKTTIQLLSGTVRVHRVRQVPSRELQVMSDWESQPPCSLGDESATKDR